jgi:hypothetical protein
MTAIIGAPYFLLLIARERKRASRNEAGQARCNDEALAGFFSFFLPSTAPRPKRKDFSLFLELI